MQYQYLQNIERINGYLEDNIDALTWDDFKSVILALYYDPDDKKNDEKLYMAIEKFYLEGNVPFRFASKDRYVLENNDIDFSLDGLISFNKILDLVYTPDEDKISIVKEAITYYRRIRKNVHGQVLFPCRREGYRTINQQRAANGMYDRIDYALADIKLYLSGDGESCKMKQVYEKNSDTKKWLEPYKGKWTVLVDDMKWTVFLDNYEIWDFKKDKQLSDYPNKREKPDANYLRNLCERLESRSILLANFK